MKTKVIVMVKHPLTWISSCRHTPYSLNVNATGHVIKPFCGVISNWKRVCIFNSLGHFWNEWNLQWIRISESPQIQMDLNFSEIIFIPFERALFETKSIFNN